LKRAEMKAEIIASGTELLLGEISDTNTSYLAGQLAILGIDLYYASIVGDNFERFLSVLKQAFKRSDIVLITGGLGPTQGDITREVISALLDEKMEIDSALKREISDFFARMHLEMTANNLKQATLIPSAIAIPNPLGTAPGWWIEKNGKIILSMPGPPGEMQPMWKKEIFPRLERKGGAVILSRNLKTWGVSEAKIDQLVAPFMAMANPTLALYAKPDGIRLRITAKTSTVAEANALIDAREQKLREILKESIWGVDDETLEESTAKLLIKKNLTVAVGETFTNGLLICSLAGVADSRRFFKGGMVVKAEQSRNLIGIRVGSDKQENQSASGIARHVREIFTADIGIGVDGYLNPQSESSQGQAFVAFDLWKREYNASQVYPGRTALLMRRTVNQVIFSLRKLLLTL
jgi:nicotinamide-nucleotide amidase